MIVVPLFIVGWAIWMTAIWAKEWYIDRMQALRNIEEKEKIQ